MPEESTVDRPKENADIGPGDGVPSLQAAVSAAVQFNQDLEVAMGLISAVIGNELAMAIGKIQAEKQNAVSAIQAQQGLLSLASTLLPAFRRGYSSDQPDTE
jgi:hypothetical protein